MTRAMHSPAPFTVPNKGSPARIVDATGETIAQVYLTDLETRRRDEVHARNLLMFQHSPDMVAALRTILAGCECRGRWLDDEGNEGRDYDHDRDIDTLHGDEWTDEETGKTVTFTAFDGAEQDAWLTTCADTARAALALLEPPEPGK